MIFRGPPDDYDDLLHEYLGIPPWGRVRFKKTESSTSGRGGRQCQVDEFQMLSDKEDGGKYRGRGSLFIVGTELEQVMGWGGGGSHSRRSARPCPHPRKKGQRAATKSGPVAYIVAGCWNATLLDTHGRPHPYRLFRAYNRRCNSRDSTLQHRQRQIQSGWRKC